jgi:triosephosphate isomerase (TIM)
VAKKPARRPLIAGNWKMNLNHLEAIALVQKLAFMLTPEDYEAAEVVVLPPYTDIRSVQTLIDGDRLLLEYGAQDLSAQEKGAYTGEVSGGMLAKLGCSFSLVGHSERRAHHAETDELAGRKMAAAYGVGITPILCVGELLEVRKEGGHVAHVLGQMDRAMATMAPERAATLVVAYEPVWAIGTGEVATPEDAQEVCSAIRDWFGARYEATVADAVRLLYGGSVSPENIAGIMACRDVDGALVGGASLDAESFTSIVRYRLHPPPA